MPDTPERSTALHSVPRWSLIALAVVFVIYALLVVGAVRGKGALWHDEAVSVLEATGHVTDWYRFEFEGAGPYGEWATAADYQAFQSVDRPFDLQGVSRDLGEHDWHPPAFFWLQHLALLVGVSPLWSGPFVNILLGGVLALVAFGLILRFSSNPLAAVLVSATALWSPAIVLSAGEARHYLLYALVLLALGAAGASVVDDVTRGRGLSRGRLVGFGVVIAAGLLANHQFFVNAVLAVGLIWLLTLPRWRVAGRVAAASAAGALASWLVFPYFIAHLGSLGDRTAGFQLDLVAGRAGRWLDGALDMVTLAPSYQGFGRFVLRGALVLAVVAAAIWWRAVWRWAVANRARAFPVLLAIGSTAVPAAAYVAQRFLDNIEGGHYVAPLWPLLVVSVSLVVLTIWPRRGVVPVGVMALALLGSCTVWVASLSANGDAMRGLIGTVASADALVVDCVSRGYFPTITEFLDPDTAVFAARGEDVVALIASGWAPAAEGDTYLLHSNCTGGPDVVQVIRDSDLGDPTWVGTLERLQVWRLAGR
jgi:hypothetical protein